MTTATRVALVLTLAAIVASTTAPARAGTYTVHACTTPAGVPAPYEGWRFTGDDDTFLSSAGCPSAGPLAVTIPGRAAVSEGHGAKWRFTAPADTAIAAYALDRDFQVLGDDDTVGWEYGYAVYDALAGGDDAESSQRCDGAAECASLLGAGRRFAHVVPRAAVQQVYARVKCQKGKSGACPDAGADVAATLRVFHAEVTLEDALAPQFTTKPSGSLLATDRTLTGVQDLHVEAADRGGGVATAVLEVDGVEQAPMTIDDNKGACRQPYTAIVPCRPSAAATLRYDTAALADGQHSLRVLVRDATGSNQAADGPYTIRTANHPTAAPAAGAGARLVAWVTRARPRRGAKPRAGAASPAGDTHGRASGARTAKARPRRAASVHVPYGAHVVVRGRLVDAAGRPLAGAQLRVATVERAAGAQVTDRGTITTRANGTYAYDPGAGPSRLIQLAYKPQDGAAPVATAAVRVHVAARATLRITPRHRGPEGGRILLYGRLLGGPFPAVGRLLEIQARSPRGWRTIATTRATETGRFKYRYTFLPTPQPTRYHFRVRVRYDGLYPYSLGYSPMRSVVIG